MTLLRKCLIALAFFAPALAGCDLSDGPTITDDWRKKAAEDLLRSKVVRINETIIRDHISGLDGKQARLFVDATLNEFAQCIAFRKAQADTLRTDGLRDATIYEEYVHNIERHRDLFVVAAQRVLAGTASVDGLYTDSSADTVKHMHTIQPDRISLQQDHADSEATDFAKWQRRCDGMDASLKSSIEQHAHLRLTPIEIEVRAHRLAANQN